MAQTYWTNNFPPQNSPFIGTFPVNQHCQPVVGQSQNTHYVMPMQTSQGQINQHGVLQGTVVRNVMIQVPVPAGTEISSHLFNPQINASLEGTTMIPTQCHEHSVEKRFDDLNYYLGGVNSNCGRNVHSDFDGEVDKSYRSRSREKCSNSYNSYTGESCKHEARHRLHERNSSLESSQLDSECRNQWQEEHSRHTDRESHRCPRSLTSSKHSQDVKQHSRSPDYAQIPLNMQALRAADSSKNCHRNYRNIHKDHFDVELKTVYWDDREITISDYKNTETDYHGNSYRREEYHGAGKRDDAYDRDRYSHNEIIIDKYSDNERNRDRNFSVCGNENFRTIDDRNHKNFEKLSENMHLDSHRDNYLKRKYSPERYNYKLEKQGVGISKKLDLKVHVSGKGRWIIDTARDISPVSDDDFKGSDDEGSKQRTIDKHALGSSISQNMQSNDDGTEDILSEDELLGEESYSDPKIHTNKFSAVSLQALHGHKSDNLSQRNDSGRSLNAGIERHKMSSPVSHHSRHGYDYKVENDWKRSSQNRHSVDSKNLYGDVCHSRDQNELCHGFFNKVHDIMIPNLCYAHNKNGCHVQHCGLLHVCRHFILGSCKFGDLCTKSHNLFKEQTLELLKYMNPGFEHKNIKHGELVKLISEKLNKGRKSPPQKIDSSKNVATKNKGKDESDEELNVDPSFDARNYVLGNDSLCLIAENKVDVVKENSVKEIKSSDTNKEETKIFEDNKLVDKYETETKLFENGKLVDRNQTGKILIEDNKPIDKIKSEAKLLGDNLEVNKNRTEKNLHKNKLHIVTKRRRLSKGNESVNRIKLKRKLTDNTSNVKQKSLATDLKQKSLATVVRRKSLQRDVSKNSTKRTFLICEKNNNDEALSPVSLNEVDWNKYEKYENVSDVELSDKEVEGQDDLEDITSNDSDDFNSGSSIPLPLPTAENIAVPIGMNDPLVFNRPLGNNPQNYVGPMNHPPPNFSVNTAPLFPIMQDSQPMMQVQQLLPAASVHYIPPDRLSSDSSRAFIGIPIAGPQLTNQMFLGQQQIARPSLPESSNAGQPIVPGSHISFSSFGQMVIGPSPEVLNNSPNFQSAQNTEPHLNVFKNDNTPVTIEVHEPKKKAAKPKKDYIDPELKETIKEPCIKFPHKVPVNMSIIEFVTETETYKAELVSEILKILVTMNLPYVTMKKLMTLIKEKLSITIKTESDMRKILEMFPSNFQIIETADSDGENSDSESRKNVKIKANVNLGFCEKHGFLPFAIGKCGCNALHICKFYFLSKCSSRHCKFGHKLKTDHNVAVLKQHKLHRLTGEEIMTFMADIDNRTWSTIPAVCKYYSREKGCYKGDNTDYDTTCHSLHICCYFAKGQCLNRECERSHSIWDKQPLSLLEKYGLDPNEIGEERVMQMLNGQAVDKGKGKYRDSTFKKSQHNDKHIQKNHAENQVDKQNVGENVALNNDVPQRYNAKVPAICKFYNNESGCKKKDWGPDGKCYFLHICYNYVIGDCNLKENCKRSHDLFTGPTAEMLNKYNIDTSTLSAGEILSMLNKATGIPVEIPNQGSGIVDELNTGAYEIGNENEKSQTPACVSATNFENCSQNISEKIGHVITDLRIRSEYEQSKQLESASMSELQNKIKAEPTSKTECTNVSGDVSLYRSCHIEDVMMHVMQQNKADNCN